MLRGRTLPCAHPYRSKRFPTAPKKSNKPPTCHARRASALLAIYGKQKIPREASNTLSKRRAHLKGRREAAVDLVHLVLETPMAVLEQQVGLVENEHVDADCVEALVLKHLRDSARGARHDLGALLKVAGRVRHAVAADGAANPDVKEVSQNAANAATLSSKLSGGRKHDDLGAAHGLGQSLQSSDQKSNRPDGGARSDASKCRPEGS